MVNYGKVSEELEFKKSTSEIKAAFKILNKFVDYGILNFKEIKSKNKIFSINNDVVIYKRNGEY